MYDSSVGLLVMMSSKCLIFCSSSVSCCCSFFFLCTEDEMIMPLNTALPRDGDDFGESFLSRKDVHSFLMRLSNSGSLRRDVLKHHLVLGLYGVVLFHVNVTGA